MSQLKIIKILSVKERLVSYVTRIFIVLTTIFSIFFMSYIQQYYHIRENYKAALIESENNLKLAREALNQSQSQARDTINSLKQQLIEKDRKNRNLIDQITTNDQRIAELQAGKRQVESNNQEISDQLRVALANASQSSSRIQELEEKTEFFRQTSEGAQEQLELAMDHAAQEEFRKNTYREQVVDLNRQIIDLQDQKYSAEIKLQTYSDTYGPLDPIDFVPVIKGKIVGIGDEESGIVVIDRGSKDQVKVGYSFNVFRDGSFIGKVRVDSIQEDICVAYVEKDFLRGQIQELDDVSTR